MTIFNLKDGSCECLKWDILNSHYSAHYFGNGHHPTCPLFVAYSGAIKLLSSFANELETQTATMPDKLWDAFAKAYFISRGRMPTKDEQPYQTMSWIKRLIQNVRVRRRIMN